MMHTRVHASSATVHLSLLGRPGPSELAFRVALVAAIDIALAAISADPEAWHRDLLDRGFAISSWRAFRTWCSSAS